MTAHKSKGLEFQAVFIPHLTSRSWSGKAGRQNFKVPLAKYVTEDVAEYTEDERRLLYVAMTRAKQQLFFSYSEQNADKSVLEATKYLHEIDGQFVSEKETSEVEAEFEPLATLAKRTEPQTLSPKMLATVLAERGFSATSLNNYLRSPWDYLYRNVLRIPEVQALPMQYGTAVHNTLEYATKTHRKTKSLPTDSALKAKLELELSRLPLAPEEFVQLLEKGLSELLPYADHLKGVLPKQTKEEFSVRVMLETGVPELPEIPLTGKLDRIDIGDDGSALRVFDYKTGKPKTRNAIEGKTKTSDGGYKRQLVFYALLLELHDDDRYRTREGVLSFVQPDSKGVIHEETFIVTDEEITELKAEISGAVQEIVSGKCLSASLEDSDYAELAKLWLQR